MHHWTESELYVVCACYKENLPVELALRLTNTTDEKSMEMRYRNCLYLDKGPVEGALSHASKKHIEAWEKVKAFYEDKEPLQLTGGEKVVYLPAPQDFMLDGMLLLVLALLVILNVVKLVA